MTSDRPARAKPSLFEAIDPSGKAHRLTSKRPIAFAIFVKFDDYYHPYFAKTVAAAKASWGIRGVGLVKARNLSKEA